MSSASPSTSFAAWLERGQTRERQGQLADALADYDHAIAAARDARERGLAWMNRGNALQKSATPAALADAIAAYDRAIADFLTLPYTAMPALRNHLGAAWLNRGHAFIVAGNSPGAIASFERAVESLAPLPLETDPYYRLNLVGAQTNLAHCFLETAPDRARVVARTALALLAEVDRTQAPFAEMSLRARRALVTAIGELLVGNPAPGELAAEASDAIDDGLELARLWESRGIAELRPLAARLFRLGAQLYRIHQPHFLAEYLLENLAHPAFASDAEFRAAADEALILALVDARRPRMLVAGTPEATRALEIARSLRAAREHLFPESLSSRSA